MNCSLLVLSYWVRQVAFKSRLCFAFVILCSIMFMHQILFSHIPFCSKQLTVLLSRWNFLHTLRLGHVVPHIHVQRVVLSPLQKGVEVSTLMVDREVWKWLQLCLLLDISLSAFVWVCFLHIFMASALLGLCSPSN